MRHSYQALAPAAECFGFRSCATFSGEVFPRAPRRTHYVWKVGMAPVQLNFQTSNTHKSAGVRQDFYITTSYCLELKQSSPRSMSRLNVCCANARTDGRADGEWGDGSNGTPRRAATARVGSSV